MFYSKIKNVVFKHSTFSKYFLVGLFAFVIDTVAFITFRNFLAFSLANSYIIGMITGMTISFTVNHSWVFNKSFSFWKSIQRFAMFIANNFFVLATGTWLIVTLVEVSSSIGHDQIREILCKTIIMVFVVAWNYTIYSRLIFKNEMKASDEIPN